MTGKPDTPSEGLRDGRKNGSNDGPNDGLSAIFLSEYLLGIHKGAEFITSLSAKDQKKMRQQGTRTVSERLWQLLLILAETYGRHDGDA